MGKEGKEKKNRKFGVNHNKNQGVRRKQDRYKGQKVYDLELSLYSVRTYCILKTTGNFGIVFFCMTSIKVTSSIQNFRQVPIEHNKAIFSA